MCDTRCQPGAGGVKALAVSELYVRDVRVIVIGNKGKSDAKFYLVRSAKASLSF